jgi:uncharacterized protein (DUF697 family)
MLTVFESVQNMIDFFVANILKKMNNNSRADKVIRDSVIWSMGAGLIPVPLADMVAVSAVQIDMLKQIASLYQVDFAETRLKSWIAALSGSVLPKLGAGVIKFIPGIGSLVGGLSMAALSGASTYAIGQVFAKHFETGGTLLDFDVEKFKDFYQRQFEVGKAFVESLSKEKIFGQNQQTAESQAETPTAEETATSPTAGAAPETQVKETATSATGLNPEALQRLKDLTDLYEKGMLNQEEFKILKEKIIKEGQDK